MKTVSEIEAVIESLSPTDKQELLLFLAASLRAQNGHLPAPRKFSSEQVKSWIVDDEAEMQRFRDSKPK